MMKGNLACLPECWTKVWNEKARMVLARKGLRIAHVDEPGRVLEITVAGKSGYHAWVIEVAS